MTNPENGPVYQVKLSKKINKAVKDLHKQAAQQGRGQPYLASLETIHHRLQKDPRTSASHCTDCLPGSSSSTK
jgi:hypothetical protein